MKKIVLAVFLFSFIIIPTLAQAGLVPCGLSVDDPSTPKNETLACGFCDFFKLIDNLFDFVMRMVIVVATLMLVVGGVYFFFAGANPGALETGKKIITSTIIGLVIIFSAFLIVGTVLSAIGLADWTQNIYKNWWSEGFFQIPDC